VDPKRRTVIAATGSYLPERRVANEEFERHEFIDPATGQPYPLPPTEIVAKFEQITGIGERRYVTDDLMTSDIAALAAVEALSSSAIDPESLDYVIVAHNFGDVAHGNRRSDFVPSLAARVKAKIGIRNPRAIAYDLPFGCPGWLQGVIQADYFLKSGDADRALVIGAETLSRVCDPHDRDSMIYSDGAGAVVLEARVASEPTGILSHAARSDTAEHAFLLWMGPSSSPEHANGELYLKMDGHKVYEYAVRTVPEVVQECLAKAGASLEQVKKVFIHQANAKMDEAILKRLLRSAGLRTPPEELMPMTVGWLGNSSVATLPTLYDLVSKGELNGHGLHDGDLIVFASVGAGMNINAVAYRVG
jgi:3-oxoacyl-[acyl-carrier-protein] synthase III